MVGKMAKKKSEPKPLEPDPKQITDLEEFQSVFGADWQRITEMPAFRAGLQLLNVRALNEITSMSNEDIEKYGMLILANLIGLLRHENNIFGLHNQKTFKFPVEEEPEYISPEQEAEMFKLKEKFTQENRRQRYG